MRAYTKTEIEGLVDRANWAAVNRWLWRGDGIAVYENADLTSRNLGHCQFLSFGSAAALIEAPSPPHRMPDIGSKLNWQYRLAGVYRGDPLGSR